MVVDRRESTQIERVLAREAARPGWTQATVEQVLAAGESQPSDCLQPTFVFTTTGKSLDELTQILRRLAVLGL
jgi:hypothetical protein